MTNELQLFRAVATARNMLRENREPATAARIAASAHGLGSMDEPLIRRYAVVAEHELAEWRRANPQPTTTRKDES